jgi:hypothetical protein
VLDFTTPSAKFYSPFPLPYCDYLTSFLAGAARHSIDGLRFVRIIRAVRMQEP